MLGPILLLVTFKPNPTGRMNWFAFVSLTSLGFAGRVGLRIV